MTIFARSARPLMTLLVLAVVAACTGCGDDEVQKPPAATAAADAGAAAKDGGGGGDTTKRGAAEVADAGIVPPKIEFQESDFAETDRSRDPFRDFAALFQQQGKAKRTAQREVLVEKYSLDELKLAGIVTRGQSKALLIDPAGVGWTVTRGDYVGKPETVHSGGPSGVDYLVNWRVDRIREEDVVFVREDPNHPEIPPATRVITLHPAEDDKR